MYQGSGVGRFYPLFPHIISATLFFLQIQSYWRLTIELVQAQVDPAGPYPRAYSMGSKLPHRTQWVPCWPHRIVPWGVIVGWM